MKKLLLVLLLVAAMLVGCGNNGASNENSGGSNEASDENNGENNEASDESDGGIVNVEDEFKVVLLIPGNLGDRSFFDSANAGLQKLAEVDGITTRVVEMGHDETSYEPTFIDFAEGDWDVIVSGNAASDIMNDIADRFPEMYFINFDNSGTDYRSNVYSVNYATNEAAFLGGALAALITQSDMELTNDENIIGFLGGMDIPGINDFLVGYIQGAQYVNEDIQIITSYVGAFNDPVQGKEIALLQFNAGADISFNVAGASGLGLIDAAAELNKYAIGVDSDQAALFAETEPEKAEHIVTSVVKNINHVVYDSVMAAKEGVLEFGQHKTLGIEDGAVGLAKNEFYDRIPAEIRTQIDEIEQKLRAGNIEVLSGFTMSTEEIASLRDRVAP